MITPLTTIGELLKLKTNSELFDLIVKTEPMGVEKFINMSALTDLLAQVNERFGLEVLTLDLAPEKVIKALFDVVEALPVSAAFLDKYFAIVNAAAPRQFTFVVVDLPVSRMHLNMVAVHVLTSDFTRYIR